MESLESSSSIAMEESRRKRREFLQEQREFNRLKAFELNRFVESEIITEKDIAGLCSRIKRRKHATAEDLTKLGNAFIQNEANISAFIKTTGAINIIIKEFTGNDHNQQLLAAQCLCNLSLGDETCCTKIVTFAGSYLMIFMMKLSDTSMAKICLWTVQNIATAGVKSINILMSQELLKNCIHIMNSSVNHDVDAVQLLDIIIDTKWDEFTLDERKEVQHCVWGVLKKNFDEPIVVQVFCRILILNGVWNLKQDETDELVKMIAANLMKLEGASKTANEDVLYFSIRILIMSFQHDHVNALKFLEIFVERDTKLTEIINNAAANPKFYSVVKQLMQLIAQIHTNQHPFVTQYFVIDSLVNLKLPKILEL